MPGKVLLAFSRFVLLTVSFTKHFHILNHAEISTVVCQNDTDPHSRLLLLLAAQLSSHSVQMLDKQDERQAHLIYTTYGGKAKVPPLLSLKPKAKNPRDAQPSTEHLGTREGTCEINCGWECSRETALGMFWRNECLSFRAAGPFTGFVIRNGAGGTDTRDHTALPGMLHGKLLRSNTQQHASFWLQVIADSLGATSTESS